MSAIVNTANRFALPLFGSVATFRQWSKHSSRTFVAFAPMTVPLGTFFVWFMWPAIAPSWKTEVGLVSAPKTSDEIVNASKLKGGGAVSVTPMGVTFDAAAQAAIDNAHVAGGGGKVTAQDIAISQQIAAGNYSELQKEWEASIFTPGDDDDDDDDDDDEDEDDEEEEEEEEEDE
mmetsp:Transcript_14962/g.25385  ORF Transcript_14962/g.25385 Transcript_14962/m.25385 type:complete len:175 (-) Transcript_14962:120-644(-)